MFNQCSKVRWKISRSLDDREPLADNLHLHLNDCKSCRQFYQQSKNLTLQLENSQHSQRQTDPDRSSRIIRAVRLAAQDEVKPFDLLKYRLQKLALPATAIAAACLVILLVFNRGENPPSDPYLSEIERFQTDLNQMTEFVRLASEPLRFLHSEQ